MAFKRTFAIVFTTLTQLVSTGGCASPSTSPLVAGRSVGKKGLIGESQSTYSISGKNRAETALSLLPNVGVSSTIQYASEAQLLNALETANSSVVLAARAEAIANANSERAQISLDKAIDAHSKANDAMSLAEMASAKAAAAVATASLAEATSNIALAQSRLIEIRAQTALSRAIQSESVAQNAYERAVLAGDVAAVASATAALAEGKAASALAQNSLLEAKAESALSQSVQALANANSAAQRISEMGYTNVFDFGALGDGISDDTSAIRAAILAAKSNGVLFFPPKRTFVVSATLEPLAGQEWIGNGAIIKWKPELTLATRLETIFIKNSDKVVIRNISIDGNKENQSRVPTNPGGASFGSGIRLFNSHGCIFQNVSIKELPGFGVMLYSSNSNSFDDFRILNCGAKRAVSWNDTYMQNNIGDGFYLSNSNYNKVSSFEIGHDTTIANASSLRAGITITSGEHNSFQSGVVYNLSRAMHLENNTPNEGFCYNLFSNIKVPKIGDVDHAIVMYALDKSRITDNVFENINSETSRRTVGASHPISAFISANSSVYLDNYLVQIRDSKFTESISLGGYNLLFKNVNCKIFEEISPVGLRARGVLQNVKCENIFASVSARGLKLLDSHVRKGGNIIGGGSTCDSPDDLIRVENCVFDADLTNGPALTLLGPVSVTNSSFVYSGTTNSTNGFISLTGSRSYVGTYIPSVFSRNYFVNATNSSAFGIGFKYNPRYLPTIDNILIGVPFSTSMMPPADGVPIYYGNNSVASTQESPLFSSPNQPTTGTWQKGSIVLNSSLATGKDIGWVCIGSGTPGAWLSMGSATQNLSSTVILDFPPILPGTTVELPVPLSGVKVGDALFLGPPSGLEAGLISVGLVLSPDLVRIRLANVTSQTIDPIPNVWKATVIKQ